MYTIELKLERRIPMKEKRIKVETVMDQLNLKGCSGVRIGNSENRGISGRILHTSLHFQQVHQCMRH